MKPEHILYFARLFAKIAKRSDPEYMKKYMRERYKNKRQEALDLLGNKCKECGAKDVQFHLDHIDSKKKTFRAADIHSVSDKEVKKEMKNFHILCVPCHKKKTQDCWDRGVSKSTHGTYWMYRQHGCRCKKCTKAYKEKQKEWRTK